MFVSVWISVLLLAYLCYLLHTAIDQLQSIAVSTSEIDRQMVAFINGGGDGGNGVEIEQQAKENLGLNYHHLCWWGYLGRRLYSNQASLNAQFEKRRDEAERRRLGKLLAEE